MLSDLNMQINNIKLQLKSIQSQFENVENQMKFMGMTFIGSQIQNLGIQMTNCGIQMLNIGIKLPDMNNNCLNINNQIQNIKMQIQNIEMNCLNMNNENKNIPVQMPNFGMMGMMMPNMEMFNNEFNNPQNNNVKQELNDFNLRKKNIVFTLPAGNKVNITFNEGTTIDEVLKTFLKRIGKPELINTKDELFFLYNGLKLNFGDKTKVEDLDSNIREIPQIIVVSTKDVI